MVLSIRKLSMSSPRQKTIANHLHFPFHFPLPEHDVLTGNVKPLSHPGTLSSNPLVSEKDSLNPSSES